MHESWHTDYNSIKEEIERFEQMEKGKKNLFFDVHIIESIFDFYSDKFQFEKAERILQIGIYQHPQATSLQAKMSIILLEKGDDIGAISLMEELIKLEQSNSEIYLNLGSAYMRTDRQEDAINCFRKSLEVAFEEKEDILLEIAINLNQEEAFHQTIQILEPETPNYPMNENLLFELAYAYDKENVLDKGHEAYEKVLELNPFSENAWYNLGILFIKKSEFNNAIACYDYTLALNPEHGEALFNKGNSLTHLQKWKEAIDCYIEYVSLNYPELLPYHYIADCFDQLENHDLAIRFYELTTRTDPAYLPAWLGYLASLINNESGEAAIKASLEAISHQPEYGELWYLRARSFLLTGELKEAGKAFEVAISDDPNNLRNFFEYYQLIRTLYPKKQPGRIFNNWIKEYPESAAIHYLAAVYYTLEQKNPQKAISFFKTALNLDPGIFEILIDYFPELKIEIDKSDKLKQLIIKHIQHEF